MFALLISCPLLSGCITAPMTPTTTAAPPASDNRMRFLKHVMHNYYDAWDTSRIGEKSPPPPNVLAKVTIDRSGRVISKRIIKPSGNRELDASVQETLNRVTFIAPFPAEFKESQREFIIRFNLDCNCVPAPKNTTKIQQASAITPSTATSSNAVAAPRVQQTNTPGTIYSEIPLSPQSATFSNVVARARALAVKWGEPREVRWQPAPLNRYVVEYETTETEGQLLGLRAVLVATNGEAWFAPRE